VQNSLIQSVLKVCKILNTHSVEYLIVGGTAVALHGYLRQSHDPSGQLMEKHDLDFWYNPTYDNYFHLLDALGELGLDVTEFKEETIPNPQKSFFRLEQENFQMDFLPELPGLSKFRQSFEKRITSKIYDIEISYISYDDLIKNKAALGRSKDQEDIDQLKKRKKSN
jgi:predicted nucleotidyltransferase